MNTAQWPQDKVVMMRYSGATMEEEIRIIPCQNPKAEKEEEMMIKYYYCPRCNSTNTKFCYYNNYSLSQPRYFCKTCRRYWTEGGSLRNIPIPVGGGSRKNKNHPYSKINLNMGFPSNPFKNINDDLLISRKEIITNPAAAAEFRRPSCLNFSLHELDGLGCNYGSFQGVQETNGKALLFPFQDFKTEEAALQNNQNQHAQHTTGSYWN